MTSVVQIMDAGYTTVNKYSSVTIFCTILYSNVIYTLQYYTHRQRMAMVDKEDETEKINRIALGIAREVAEDTGTLLAGGVSNTDLFLMENEEDPSEKVRAMFEEQVRWSKEEGVDYVIAETIGFLKEAKIAVEVIRSFDLPAVVTLAIWNPPSKKGENYTTEDGVPIGEACRSLLDMGATLVGVNCSQGPLTIIEVVEEICQKVPPEKVCALPATFRTTDEIPAWQLLEDKVYPKNNPVYPNGLDAFYVSEAEIVHFTERCLELGLKYIGLCCGNSGNYTRVMAEAMGKEPPCNKYRNEVSLKKRMNIMSKRIEMIKKARNE